MTDGGRDANGGDDGDSDGIGDSDDDGDGGGESEEKSLPDVVAVRDRIVSHLTEFVRALRRAGVEVHANATLTAARALVEIGFDDEARVRAALKATLVSRREDVETFDRLFEAFWRQLTADLYARDTGGEDRRENVGVFAPTGADSSAGADTVDEAGDGNARTIDGTTNWRRSTEAGESEGERIETAVYSPTGRSEPLSVPTGHADSESLDRALKRLTRALATVRGRRWDSGGTDHADARRALRRSFSTGGTVVSIPERERKRTAVRCTVLVDVSRSVLDTIDRAFLIRFLRAVTAEWRGTRTFLFDTHAREVSRELAAPSIDASVEAFRRAEAEWGGGTRIGDALATVRHEHPDAIDRRTAVLVISDGLEMGEIDVLEDGMSWLSGRARLVLWGNPLASAPEYEPTARGMAVSLPYLDGLFAFTDAADVAEIARQLELRGTKSIGYAYDPRRRARQ